MADCDAVRDILPELVVGALPGDERASALSHVARCAACQSETDALVIAMGSLLEIVPPVDPPVGFEDRLLARRSVVPVRRPRRSLRERLFAGAAAVALLASGAGIGIAALGTGATAGAALRSPLRAASGKVGEVVVVPGHPSVFAMTVDVAGWSGWVQCAATYGDGRHVDLGRLYLRDGYGSWASELRTSDLRSAVVEAPDGAILGTARFGS